MAGQDLSRLVGLVDRLQQSIRLRQRGPIVDAVSQLVAAHAPMGAQWQQIAYMTLEYGELTLARAAMELFVEATDGRPTSRFQKMSFLAAAGDWDEAYALMRALPEHVPDTFANIFSRASTALYAGKSAEARDYFQRATQMRPQSGASWFGLSIVTDFAREPELADGLVAASGDMAGASITEQAAHQYALGKALAELGQHKQGFAAFARAGQLRKAEIRYDAAADQAEADQALAGYDAARIAAIAARQSEATGRTIFVTGPARSGTTLVEQILASHSSVTGGGETSRLMLLGLEVGGASWTALSSYVEENGADAAARLWHHWLDELCPGAQRVVDKSLTTSRYLGLAAALLPDAPVIWMTRDPLDCAWSCFRTNFVGMAMPWSFDLTDIAAHLCIEAQLLARWREILGDRLLVVPYEALVTDPAPWIRRILTHAGLSEEPQVFAPHEHARLAGTASMMQVRRPINRDGIGAAAPYRAFMEPFVAAYGA